MLMILAWFVLWFAAVWLGGALFFAVMLWLRVREEKRREKVAYRCARMARFQRMIWVPKDFLN